MNTATIQITENCLIEGKHCAVGDIMTVSLADAVLVVGMGRARWPVAVTVSEPWVETTEQVPVMETPEARVAQPRKTRA